MFEQLLQSLEVSGLIMILFLYLYGYRLPWWSNRQRECTATTPKKPIPGPFSLPYLGTAWVYSRFGGYAFTKVHEFYKDAFARYGTIMKEEALGNIPVISVITREDIEKVLKSSGKYPIRPPTEAVAVYRKTRPDRYASTGIVNEQGEQWLQLRTSLTSDLTKPKTIASFLPQVEEIADDWCHLLTHLKNKSPVVNLEDLASRLGLEAICALVLGRRMGFLLVGEESNITSRLAKAVSNHFIACRDTYYGLPLWKLIATPAYKKLASSEEAIYTLVLELIESADEATRESAVFESVLKADVDPREKTAAIVDFIAAGIYTLRNSLLFLLHLIAEDAGIQTKLFEDDGEAYAKACMLESFRFIPTANCLARVVEEEIELSGYKLPPGSVVLCHSGLACRSEDNFKDADVFKPERWLGEMKAETVGPATFLVIPFGVGRRMCPGKRFIEQVLPVVVKRTVGMYKMKIVRPLELTFEFLLAPKGPVKLVFEERG